MGVQNGVTEFPDSLCMYLYAGSREADTNAVLKSRQNTKFTLKVINFDNLKNSVTRGNPLVAVQLPLPIRGCDCKITTLQAPRAFRLPHTHTWGNNQSKVGP